MAIEIEKKYLLTSQSHDLVSALQNEGLELQKHNVLQYYTKINENEEIRFRQIENTYFKTIKKGQGLKREEIESSICKEEFDENLKDIKGLEIKKIRYSFKLQNFPANIDIYDSNLNNMAVLEIEFDDENQAIEFKLPSIFRTYITKDITEDKEYKNKYLALCSLQDRFDIDKLFLHIKQEPLNYDFLLDIPKTLNAYEGMRSIYYSLYEKINHYKNLGFDDDENLHQFRVNIRKTRSLLQSVQGVIDEHIANKFIHEFKSIANATNSKRDIDVFKSYLNTLDDIEAENILQVLNDYMQNEQNLNLFCDEQYTKTMQEFLVVIKDKDRFFQGSKADLDITQIAAISLMKRFKKIEKKLLRLDEHTSLHQFHRARIEFKKLRYLSEFFSLFLKQKSLDKTIKISKKMQELFGNLQDKDSAKYILTDLQNNTKYCEDVLIIYSAQKIEEILNDEIYAIKIKILRKKDELFACLKFSSKDLKNIG